MDTNNTIRIKKMNYYFITNNIYMKIIDYFIKIIKIILYFIIINSIIGIIIIRIICFNDISYLFICQQS